jgi:uncharacterized protein (TIGR03067 family)
MPRTSRRKSDSKSRPHSSALPGDLQKLQGSWNVTSLEADGQKMPHAAFHGSQIVIEGDKFTSIAMGATYKGTIGINELKRPKAFDLVFTAGPERGNRNLGIYKLEGDVWTICLNTRGGERPQKFATQADTEVALETLERVRGAKANPRAKKAAALQPGLTEDVTKYGGAEDSPAGNGPATELEGEWAMISAVFNGQPLDPSMVKFCKRITRGNVTTVLAGPQTMLKAQFTLDNSKHPNAINYVNLHGANKGKSQLGIFELSGSELKIRMSAPGQPRPADFSSKPGDGRNYTSWRLDRK